MVQISNQETQVAAIVRLTAEPDAILQAHLDVTNVIQAMDLLTTAIARLVYEKTAMLDVPYMELGHVISVMMDMDQVQRQRTAQNVLNTAYRAR
jgi:hypothetical protein